MFGKRKRLTEILVLGAVASGMLLTSACGQAEDEKLGEAVDLALDERVIERSGTIPKSFAGIIEDAQGAVVSVHTARVVSMVNDSGPSSREEELLRRFFGIPSPGPQQPEQDGEMPEQRQPMGVGSGVIVKEDGYILTNSHVVTGQSNTVADEILVRLNDGREMEAEVIGFDPGTDVAVLKIDAQGLPAIPIADSENIKIGDIVFAIGNPLGVGQTVTQGIISATGRAIGIYGAEGYESFIQTDASINPGNSGGALIDVDGRLIGINSAILSRSGGNIGIGFAIPSNLAVAITSQLTAFGEVRRGFLGIQIRDLGPDMAEAFDLESADGALVEKVEKGSPAEAAGFEVGDIIVEVAGRPVTSANQLRIRVSQIVPESDVEIAYYRNGERKTVTAQLGDRDKLTGLVGGGILEGVEARPVDDELRGRYGLPDDLSGVAITGVDPNSGYGRQLNEGMVILEINGTKVRTVDEVRELLRDGVNRLYVYDRGRVGFVALRKN